MAMGNHVNGLDHVVVGTRDLDRARLAFERLGFTVTPRGDHAGWGTANHCLMFTQDYVELLAPVGAGEQAERVRGFTAGREGLMAVAIGSGEVAADVERLRAAGLDVALPRAVSRMVPTVSGSRDARFAVATLPPEATAGVPVWLCQHLTPDVLRQPGWTDHPNGALAIASVTAVVGQPADLAPSWEVVFGSGSATPTDNTVTIHGGRGLIFLTRPDELTQLHPEAELDAVPAPPALVALSVLVADTDRAARVLTENGVAHSRDTVGTVRVAASDACGVFLELVGA